MAVEPGGGGKLRNKRNHGNKPYTRHNAENKSLFRRVTDTVASIIIPTWMPNFMSWKSEEEEELDLNENHHPHPPHQHHQQENVREDLGLESTSSVHMNENNVAHGSGVRSHPTRKLWPRAISRSDLTAPDGSYDSGAFSTQSVISNEFPQWSAESEPVRRSQTSFSLQSECGVGVPPSNIHVISKEPVPDNRSECSDASVSTSGCSSMIPHPDRREYQREILQLNDSSLRQLSEKLTRSCLPTSRPSLHVAAASDRAVKETTSGPFLSTPDINSVVESNTSLESHLGNSSRMDDSRNCIQHSKPQPSSAGKKPTFNVDAFENPVWNDRSILNESLISSPFYGGPTAFGGASSTRRNKYQSYLPYSAPSKSSKRLQVRVRNLNTTADVDNLDCMSLTTRRILDSLEKMSTPLTDAKKIPSKTSFADSPFMINQRTTTRRPNLTGPDPHGSLPLRRGPPLNRLQTPIAGSSSKQPRLDVLKAKVMNPKYAISQRILETSVWRSAMENPKNDSPKFGWTSPSLISCGSNKPTESRKMKTRQTMHYSSKPTADEIVEPPLDLPQIPLPITNLPTFNFDLTTKPPVKANDYKNISAVNFRLPSEVGMKTVQKTAGEDSDDIEFVFSSPLKVTVSEPPKEKEKTRSVVFTSTPTPNGNFAFNSTTSTILKRKPQSPEISTTPVLGLAKEFKMGSVMDLLKSEKFTSAGKSTESSGKSKDSKSKDEQPEGTWSCPKCSINNQDSKNSCASCSTLKPGHVSSAPLGFGDMFKPKAGSWECSICSLRNEGGSSKCVACETPKPSAEKKVEATPMETSSVSTFGNQFKKPSGYWDCDTCWVQNKGSDNTCSACNSPRLNSIQTTNTTVPEFKFGYTGKTATTSSTTESTGFKFGLSNASTNVATTFRFGSLPATKTTAPAFVFGSGTLQTDSKTVPNLFGAKPLPENKEINETKKEIEVIDNSIDKKSDDDDDVTEIIEEKKEPVNKPMFGLAVPSAPMNLFGSTKPETEKTDKSWMTAPKPTEQFGFFGAETVETPKSAEKHKHDSDDVEVPKKKMLTLEPPMPSFSSLIAPNFTPLKPSNVNPLSSFKTPELASTAPNTTTSKTSSFSTKTAAIAVSTNSSEFLTPALPVTSAATSSLFRQITTASELTPGFFTAPSTVTTPTSKIPTASSAGSVFGTQPTTMFGSSKTGYNTQPMGSNAMFGSHTSPSSVTLPSYGYLTTSAGSGFGTTTTNSTFSPASSSSVFQSPPAAITTTTPISFFGTAPAAKSSFSFGQTTTVAAVPQFNTTTPTVAATVPSFTVPVTTTSFNSLSTPNLFAFGNQNASIFGGPATTQVATPTTTAAAMSFAGFGSTPRPAFQVPQLTAPATPAFAPVAPTNRFPGSGTPGFQFGGNNQQQQSAGIFQFTGTQEKTEPEAATTFHFNQPATTQPGFQFNAGTATAFNFGAGGTASPIPTFGPPGVPQNPNPSGNPFEMPVTTAAPTIPSNRLFRRARRRK
uniref:Nuclear pore complex protein Nup153 n=1 Tax=Strigamia maritima TaxID=126957 RepID=T1J2Y7_STRMM